MEENNNVIEMQETEVVEVEKESKVKNFFGKAGSGVKRHWKTIAVGAGALAVGVVLGLKKGSAEDADETYEDEVPEGEDNTNETL